MSGQTTPDPPAKTLVQILFDCTRDTMTTRRLSQETPWADRLREFATESLDDLAERRPGNAEDLGHLWAELEVAQLQIRDLAAKVQALDGDRNPRSWSAALNVLSATQFVNAALLLHLRSNIWYENSVFILLRTALEQTARAAFILNGIGREASDWSDGTTDPRPSKSIPALAAAVAQWWPEAAGPDVVYGWLSGFTHFSQKAVLFNHEQSGRRLTHQDGYAAVLYIAWLSLAIAQRVIGVPTMPWPKDWPSPVPWTGHK